jgi:hypothetical protein
MTGNVVAPLLECKNNPPDKAQQTVTTIPACPLGPLLQEGIMAGTHSRDCREISIIQMLRTQGKE